MGALGNDQVIIALEAMLKHARAGQAGYLIAIMIDQNENTVGGWFGTLTLERKTMAALEQMAVKMDAAVLNKTLPDRDPTVSADRVCLNIPIAPLSYDVLNWLIDAEMNRRMKGAPSPLKVAFWFGRDGNSGFETATRQRMFDRVIRPSLDLIGAIEDSSAIDGHYKPFFATRDVVNATRRGFEVPKFRAPTEHIDAMVQRFSYQSPITITLREMDLYPYRNSNLKAWLKFARYLRDRGERVVFVRDTAKANDKMDGFEICSEASIDLHSRMALYEIAKINLFVSNGPCTLGWFSDFPWMMFVRIEPDGHEYAPNTPSFWRDNFGISVGEQFPWSRPDQRIIWQPDDYENLIKAWEEFQALPAATAAAE